MTQMIARLVLAMLMLPLAVICMAVVMAIDVAILGNPDLRGVVIAWVVTDCFVVIYWIAIWRTAVRWNARRIPQTIGAAGLGALAAVFGVCGLHTLASIPMEPAVVFGNTLFPVVFVMATVFVWRETPTERLARMRSFGVRTVACPICSYNLTGMREARCPECGATFTLDELLTAQLGETRESLPDT